MAIPLPRSIRRKLNTKHVAVEVFEPVLIGVNLGKERFELHGAVADSFSSATPCGLVFSDGPKEGKPRFRSDKPDVVLPEGDYLIVRLPEGSIKHVLRDNRESNLIAAKAWLAVAKDYLETAKEFSRKVQETSTGVGVPLKKAYDASLFALRAVSVLRATPPFSDDLYSVIGTLKSLGSRIPPEWSRIEKALRHSVDRIYLEDYEEPPGPKALDTSLQFARDVVNWASRELAPGPESLEPIAVTAEQKKKKTVKRAKSAREKPGEKKGAKARRSSPRKATTRRGYGK